MMPIKCKFFQFIGDLYDILHKFTQNFYLKPVQDVFMCLKWKNKERKMINSLNFDEAKK